MKKLTKTEGLNKTIAFLLRSFKIERFIYLIVTIVSIVLLGFLTYILLEKQDVSSVLALMGPTGLITFTFSRVLKMWTDCVDLVKINLTSNLADNEKE